MWTKIVCAVCGHSTVTENHLLRAPHCSKCGGPVRLHTASEADIAGAQSKTSSGVAVGQPVKVSPQQGFTLAGMTVKPPDRAFELLTKAIEMLNDVAKLYCDASIVDKTTESDLSRAARIASTEYDPTDLPMTVRTAVEAPGGPEPTHYGAAEPERDPELPPGMP